MAVKLVIEPIFEADFCDNSYGFRPERSAHDAIDDVSYALNRGYTEVIDADLSKYFDTIPHAKLMAVVAGRIDMRYQHINKEGELMTGNCISAPEILPDGRIRLKEKWQWIGGNCSEGESVVEEI